MDLLKQCIVMVFISLLLVSVTERKEKTININIEQPKRTCSYTVEPGTLDQIINEAATRWGFHPEILHAIAYIESNKQHLKAVPEPNKTYSYGMFQINDIYAKDEKIKPEQIIKDSELAAHLAAKKIGLHCKARISKAKTIKEQLELAYGCYRGTWKDSKVYNYLKNKNKLTNIKSFWG